MFNKKFSENIGCISIGENCFIGLNSVLLYDIQIGDNCIVSAGSIVTKDIPSDEIWGGVPAKNKYSSRLYRKN